MKRIVAEKLLITGIIASLGAFLVYLGSSRGIGFWLTLVGLVIVALSPAISYLVILAKLKKNAKNRQGMAEQ